MIIVKNIISLTYILNTLRSLRPLRCMILVTAKSAKSAKISLNCLVFDYNTLSEADLDKKGSNFCCMVKFNTVWIYGFMHVEML